MFFKVIQYGYETFQNVTRIRHYVICSENNTASITKKRLCKRKGVVTSSCFLWMLFFVVKRFDNLLHIPIYGLLRLLSYWESINSHS